MSNRRPLRCALLLVALGAALTLTPACTSPSANLELTSYKDPYLPETYDVRLTECAYGVGPSGDRHIAGRAVHTPADNPGAPIVQLVHVHLFWKPRPGKTFADPTAADATIRYAVATEQGVAVYCGTGFVYLKKRRLSDDVVAKIETGQLRLETLAGDPPEILGSACLTGTLIAKDDASLAVDLRRQLDLYTGQPQSD